MKDILALNPEGREEEAIFSTIAQVSELNASFYKTWIRPWVKLFATREIGDAMGKMHSLRMQRALVSDAMPGASVIREWAQKARENRQTPDSDNAWLQMEKQWDTFLTDSLNQFRDWRDQQSVELARNLYGSNGLGFWFKPATPDAEAAEQRAEADIAKARAEVLKTIDRGGIAEAVCRIVMAGMVSIGAFERRSLRLARLLAQLPPDARSLIPAQVNWVQMLKTQARITAVAPVEALNALETLLPDTARRELALALSAAVMMIEPTLANPRSEIIEFLIDTLGVDPERVIGLAKVITDSVEAGPKAVKKIQPKRFRLKKRQQRRRQ